MAFKKPKTFKKVTEIPSAKVTIEVEEKTPEVPKLVDSNEEEKETNETEESTEETKEKEDIPVNIDESNSGSRFGFKKLLLTILIVVPIGFLAFGGFLYFSDNFDTGKLKKEPEKKLEIPQSSPTPTVEPLDKDAFTIEVQNGSGISGEGASVGEMLEEDGFKVGDIGNANNSNYENTVITVNDDVPDVYIEALTKVLEKRGPVGKVKKFATGEDGEVLVIVGSELGLSDEETTPTP
jgi:hypothetical protein